MKATTLARNSCARALALFASTSALSQEAPTSSRNPVERVGQIQITGTRIPPPNLEASSPVTVLTAEDIRQEGPLPIEDILSRLPQVLGEQNGMMSNRASGTSSVDLRGLGGLRSLVLVNGRRLGAGEPLFDASDLNRVPAPLVRRVDVLTGGASAVYGSDAIAGVVNFILDNRFEGVRAEAKHSFFNHRQQNPQGVSDLVAARATANPAQFKVPGDRASDGESTVANLLIGGNFPDGRGNATAFLEFREDRALLESGRDFSACALGANASGFFCSGSQTGYPGLFVANLALGGRLLTVADAQGGVRPWRAATDLYNFAPANHFRRPTQRYSFGAFADYAVSPEATLYTETGFHDDNTSAQIAESGLFGESVMVPFENPLLSADWRRELRLAGPGDAAPVLILRRNVEGGGRRAELRHTSFRGVVGLKGSIAGHWHYDAFLQAGKVRYQQAYLNDFSKSRGRRALDVVVDPATGQPACRAAVDGSDPQCVPYNIWTLGAVTREVLDYLQTPGLQSGHVRQMVLGASATGELGAYGLRLPGVREGVTVSLGLERRSEEQELIADAAFATGDLAGQNFAAPSVTGAYSVNEVFAEARLPLLEAASVNGSVRHSDYDTGRRTTTFGAGFDFSAGRLVRARGSLQRAVRVAGINELHFPAQVVVGSVTDDPCDGPTPSRSREECARTGVTPDQYGNIVANPLNPGMANVRLSGNLLLGPETGNTVTLGVVLTPTRGFSATVDYFDLKVDNTIGGRGAFSFERCLDTGDPQYCRLVRRDPAGGTLWLPGGEIDNQLDNVGRLRTSGIDVGIHFTHRLAGFGRLEFDALGTYVRNFLVEPNEDIEPYDCAGHFSSGCYQPRPKWRHRTRAAWHAPGNVSVAVTWRHVSEVRHGGTISHPVLDQPVPEVIRRLPPRDYLDLSASWDLDGHVTLRTGVDNLLDRDPPLFAGGPPQNNGNTWVGTYDPLGRRVWVALTARF